MSQTYCRGVCEDEEDDAGDILVCNSNLMNQERHGCSNTRQAHVTLAKIQLWTEGNLF